VHDAAVVDDEDVLAVADRRRHVRPFVERPQAMRLRHVAAAARLDRHERLHPRRRVDDTVGDHRRGDDAIVGVVLRIQTAETPQFLSGRGIVSRDDVAADGHDLVRAADFDERRSPVRIGGLANRLRRPLGSPDRLAARLVDAQKVRRIVGLHAVQHLHEQRVAVQERRRGVAPVEPERAVVLLDVAGPEFLPTEIERLEDPRPSHHPDVLPVGDRRGGRHVLLALPVVAAAHRPLPHDFPRLAVDRPELELTRVVCGRHVEENTLAPDNRRRSAARRGRKLPRDTLGDGPLERKTALGADPVGLRSAPLRPVLGVQSGSDGQDG
jgi:hypothetical protein